MTANELVRKIGNALDNQDGDGRYPDLEQDAMRFYVLREMLNGTPTLDKALDDKIKAILK